MSDAAVVLNMSPQSKRRWVGLRFHMALYVILIASATLCDPSACAVFAQLLQPFAAVRV